MFVYFTQYNLWVYFFLVGLLHIFPLHEWFFNCTIIIAVFILICLWIVYLCLHWNVCVFHTIYSLVVLHSDNLVLYLSCVWVILPLCCCYIHVCINMFMYIISMIKVKCLRTLHNLLLCYYLYWGSLSCMFNYLFCHCWHTNWPEFIIVDQYLFLWIYHWVITCIETHIFVSSFSIAHAFSYPLNFYVTY